KACREAKIHESILGLPNGHNTHVGGKGAQLSDYCHSKSGKVVQKALDAAAHGKTTLVIAINY
ncbi:10947_t:CDS:2, partial [Gigaspora rosea]